jgi:hypothetical protein
MILLEEAKQGESQDAETSFPGFGQQSLDADDGPIMQKLDLLAAYLGMDIPTFNEAQAAQTEIWKHQEKMMGSPTGYNPENDPSPLADKSKLEMAQAVMYGFGTNKYSSILAVLFKAFKKKLRWSGGLSENTRQRLDQDFMQGRHLDQLRYIRDEFDGIVAIQNYMFIDSSFDAELQAAHLDLTNRSEGFALPVFRAKRKGAGNGEPEVLIIFGRPDKYNVIEKSTLRASLETAEARNLIPPGILHFNLQGYWDEIESDQDWQWSEILAIIGIGLAIVAAIAAAPFTGGASTAAVPYLVTAAIGVGIASSVMSMKEKAEIGELTSGVAVFEIGMIAANFIPFLATGTRILRGIPQLAKVGKLGQFAGFITHPAVTRLGAGAGVMMTGVSAFMFAESLLTQLDVIADMKAGPEKNKAIRELIRFGALTGLMLFVSLKSDFRILKGNPKLSLHASVKAEADTRAKIKDYDARIQNAKSRFGGRAAAVVPIPEALIVVAIAKQAEVIFYQLRKVMAKLSTIKDRAAIRAAVEGNPNIKAMGLAGDEFDQAYKLAEQVDLHLANHPNSRYQGKEDELFSLLMQGKRRFNAKGDLVMASPEKIRAGLEKSIPFYIVRNEKLLQQMAGVKQGSVNIVNEEGIDVGRLFFSETSNGRMYSFKTHKGFRTKVVVKKIGRAEVVNGQLTLDFLIPPSVKDILKIKGLGALMFDDSFSYLGTKFTTFKAQWVKNEKYYKEIGGYSQNLTSFKEHYQRTKNAELAAQNTFTGKMALKHGFRVQNVDMDDLDEVIVIFTK